MPGRPQSDLEDRRSRGGSKNLGTIVEAIRKRSRKDFPLQTGCSGSGTMEDPTEANQNIYDPQGLGNPVPDYKLSL